MAMVKKINQRRTGGRKTTCVIQSPIVKRIHSRPVTLQGWLQKRGSDGLMLWKKRWFVLSDYCLFYYKDPEEEALLGSFVLASWIISPCTHKDKVYKKYSFKAEHNNMRTYYFAADNDVIMSQWLKALTMASLLQESPRPTSKINNSQMNQVRHKEYNIHKPPPPVGYNYGFSGGGRVMNPDNQPLYANAPPKPKRLNDGSTPDPSEEEARMSMYHEGTSSTYYDKTMNPHMVHGSYFPPPTNRSLNPNVLPITNAMANTSRAPSANVSVASHYECLRTSYTMNQISGGSHPPRPRSVDFLEYEHKHPQDVKNAFEPKLITLPRRPKSSMSISTPKEEALDSTHWSEESYAKKMRESSMYVRPDNETSTGSRTGSSQQDRDIATPSVDKIEVQPSSSMMIHHGQNDVSDVEVNSDHIFKRSASARLPEPEKDTNEPYGDCNDGYNMSMGATDSKKIQQREESMKRLLEWKQRMLQSPLTQKHHPEIGEIDSQQSEIHHRVQEIQPKLNCAHHQDSNLPQMVDKREQLDVTNYSAHEHPYSTNLNVQNYNHYDFPSHSSSRVGHLETVPRLMDNVVASSEMSRARRSSESDSGRKTYDDSSFDYPAAEPNASFSGQQISSNKLVHYSDSLEPGYSAVSKHSKLPNDFSSPREGSKSTLPYMKTGNVHKTMKEISVNETDEEWGLKLDEASVVKEFSYHYIKNDGTEGTFPRSKSINLSSHNAMERRLSYKMHENLNSPQNLPENYLVNENKIAKTDEMRQSPVRSKTLPVGILKNMKSKKKLDLEKSADVTNMRSKWEKSYPTEVLDKRQVFSDTETLLYETSSDFDDKDKSEISNKFPTVSSDDDRDDEVAAVLAKEHKLSHACLQETNPNTPIMICSPSKNYISGCDKSTPRNNISMSCENVAELPEENYMTMTPRKRTVSASPLKDSEQGQIGSPISNIEDTNLKGIEECPYVEMTQTGNGKTSSLSGPLQPMNHQYLNQDSKFLVRTSTFSESRRVHYESEYEISGQEPLYMEVNSVDSKNQDYQGHLMEKTEEVDPEEDELRDNRTVGGALPDILNTTAPSLVHHGSRRSDSSDADDEASKDLDSIDAPRHPRFSLSDTFRPASYYLGSSLSERAIIALNSDHPDSSDSDLVSPPPIPACSPPLDDLDTSIDSTINNKDLCLNNCKDDFHKSMSTEEKYRYNNCMSKINLPVSSNHIETGSSEEESIKSERTRHFMKRRPLSADILNCLGDINMLDSPPSRTSVKDISKYDTYEDNLSKDLYDSEKPYSTPVISHSPIKDSNSYNPYRKNGFSKNNKLFYDWNQQSTGGKVGQDTRIVNNSKEVPMKTNHENMIFTPENRFMGDCTGESKLYNLPPLDPNSVGYGRSSAPNICQDDMSAYANSSVLTMANEIQNNAPYYYSDLFKVDSRNSLHRLNKSDDQLRLDKSNSGRSYSEEVPGLTGRDGYNQVVSALSRDECLKGVPAIMYTTENAKYVVERRDVESPHSRMKVGHQHSYSFPDETRLENHRRSRSLEGLLDSKRPNIGSEHPPHVDVHNAVVNQHMQQGSTTSTMYNFPDSESLSNDPGQSDRNAAEDASKKAYVRHSRSLEDLDKRLESHSPSHNMAINQKEVLYANSEFSKKGREFSDQRVSVEKEREKIRQWDLMSSAPSATGAYQAVPHYKDNAGGPASYKGTMPNINPKLDGQTPVSSENPQKPNWDLKFSAGDLLGRTHEELVLLLIQLRRQRAAVCKSMERCHREIEAHACLTDFDSINRLEHIQKLDELKSRLIELEKQYEKGKPLVNLVDNMVKLGSLYQSGPQAVTSEKLEFNHKVQEQRILADERRDWERIRADHQDLQAKVEQLYRLDKLLQEESGTLHSLQEDKGVLERALGGLKSKLQGIHGNTAETEWYRRQQRLLERELSRVRSILALNSKKLEETVAENARLEQELVVLRQKLQLSRRTTEPGGAATAALESELCRVQLLVGNLLRQRQELSTQVRQLTEKSNSLSQQIWPSLSDSFVGTALAVKKKPSSVGWIETDLDLGGSSSPANDDACSNREHNLSPLYVNTNNSDKQNAYFGEHSGYPEDCLDEISPLNARSPDPYRSDLEDDNSKRTCGSNWREKPQEIKTVRIVKRESERRQRDRDHRSGNIGIPLTSSGKRVIAEEVVLVPISEKQGNDSSVDDSPIQNEVPEPPPTPGPRSDSVHAVWNIVRKNKLKGNMLGGGPVENLDPPDSVADSPQLSPVYLSEAARKIVEEVAWQGRGEKRAIPRERRRHHTVSGLSIIAPKHLFSQRGSRDDLDMERVLRPRLTTPDVVRSTLNRTDTSFTKETIDNILGAPGKIVIPERYIPESQPQLSREEIMKRSKKADAIRKMLCETTTVAPKEGEVKERTHSIKHQVEEEKRNREHLLQLSQILAQEVMEKSKMVAIQALASLPPIHSPIEEESDSDDSSPTNSLPLYQQRENFYS